jgi:Gluconate 2-dehydrogenase subunit 3
MQPLLCETIVMATVRESVRRRLSLLKRKIRRLGRAAFQAVEDGLESRLSRPQGLAALDRERSAGATNWFTPTEYRLVEALVSVILPSDEHGPGAREAGVADRLNRLLAQTPTRQPLYARGLRSFDLQACREMGRSFPELSPGNQVSFLRKLESVAAGPSVSSSVASRIGDRMMRLYYKWRFPAASFLSEFVDDTMKAFYTSPVAWQWLDYDGPPMPLGYLDPIRPRT